jgi:hypothetical protein
MKKQLLILLFVLICSVLYSQDLIVTTNHDSINYQNNNYATFRIAIAGGYSYWTAQSREISSRYGKLKHGFNYGVELIGYFNKRIGMGINYYASHFQPTMDYDPIPEKVRVQQIIPTFNIRAFDKQKQDVFLAGFGVGYLDYKDKVYYDYEMMKGRTIGFLCSVGFDAPVTQTMAIYIKTSFIGGIDIAERNEHTLRDKIKNGKRLGKIDVSLGFSFAK